DQRQWRVEVAAIGGEARVRQQMDPQIQIAGLRGTLPFALDPDARAFDDARRDLHLDLPARRAHPGPAAGRAGDALHHRAVADLAPLSCKPRAAAGGTSLGHLRLDGSLSTTGGLLERDLDRMLDVLAPFPGGGAPARPLEAEAGKAAALARKESVEEVAEIAVAGSLAGALPGLRLVLARKLLLALDPFPIGPQLVVLRALLGVTEHFVGFVDQLKAVGGLGVLVDVRVKLASQPPIRRLDLLLGCGPREPKRLVIVLVLRRGHALTQ